MKKLKIALVVAGIIVLVAVRPWLVKGISAVAAAPQTQTIQDIAAIGALFFIVFLTVMVMLGKKI